MKVDIYSKYKVNYISHYSHYTEDSTKFDVEIVDGEEEKSEHIVEGGKLLEDISSLLNDKDIDEVSISGNCLYFGFFDPTTGLTNDLTMIIERAGMI